LKSGRTPEKYGGHYPDLDRRVVDPDEILGPRFRSGTQPDVSLEAEAQTT